jgi:uncharacterized damage-inducible protein DinB
MASDLLESFLHSAWANVELLTFCRGLTPEQLKTSLPTGAGEPLAIMKHLIGAESYYLSLCTGSSLEWDFSEDADMSAADLAGFAADLGKTWDALLTGPFDGERMLDTRSSRLRAGVLLAQALHHANVHREQVSAILTSLGLTPPDVSCWAYGRAFGGIVPK